MRWSDPLAGAPERSISAWALVPPFIVSGQHRSADVYRQQPPMYTVGEWAGEEHTLGRQENGAHAEQTALLHTTND